MLKKIFIFLLIFIFPFFTYAKTNPFFGKYKNQISFGIGQGFDTGIIVPPPVRPVPFYIGTVQYSQPATFFRLPARQTINFSQTLGLDRKGRWNWDRYTIPIAYLTEDIALLELKKFYTGIGGGMGLQAKQNERLGAKLLFQFKITFGYHLTERLGTEFFIQHFSNANTAEENYSYAFYGISLTYNF